MTAIKTHLFAVLLTLSAMAASQAAQPGAALAVRQPQPTQAIQPRQDCSGVFECVDDSSEVDTDGIDINFSGDSSSRTASSGASVVTLASSTSTQGSDDSGLDCFRTADNGDRLDCIFGDDNDDDSDRFPRASSLRSVASDVASSVSAAVESVTGSPDGAMEGRAAAACLAAALVASLMGACIFF